MVPLSERWPRALPRIPRSTCVLQTLSSATGSTRSSFRQASTGSNTSTRKACWAEGNGSISDLPWEKIGTLEFAERSPMPSPPGPTSAEIWPTGGCRQR